MSEHDLRRLVRCRPVPAGHCPEPIIEISNYTYGPGNKTKWYRVLYIQSRDGVFYDCARTKHSYGGWGKIRMVSEYGEKIMDNATDLRLPWKIAPLEGKYYGTYILDADDEEVAQFWDHSVASHPSVREKAAFGEWSEEAWADYCCDSHWESERDYVRAVAVVTAVNTAF